jgi:hypothetical protein
VTRGQDQGDKPAEILPAEQPIVAKPAPRVTVPKSGVNPNFGMNMPMMSSAFDTAAWLRAAA